MFKFCKKMDFEKYTYSDLKTKIKELQNTNKENTAQIKELIRCQSRYNILAEEYKLLDLEIRNLYAIVKRIDDLIVEIGYYLQKLAHEKKPISQ